MSLLVAKRAERRELSEFGKCVMALARKRKIRSQAGLGRELENKGYPVPQRTLAAYLQGRMVVDPSIPHALLDTLKLNKSERRALAEAYTFGQPPRPKRRQASSATPSPLAAS